jgi:hypothetical protein
VKYAHEWAGFREAALAFVRPMFCILLMPTIAWFCGIAIRMFFNDHARPHFHAYYGSHVALLNNETGAVMAGRLPTRNLRLVQEWRGRCIQELRDVWDRAQQGGTEGLGRIPGLGDEE